MTPNPKTKQRAKRHEYYLKRRATMTPEQLAAERAYQREYERKRRAAMTPEQLAADNAYKLQLQRRRTRTPKELDAQRTYQREYRRKRRATRTAEQLKGLREYQREDQRKWRAAAMRPKIASTTSTQDSGLYGFILPLFKQKAGIDVKVVAQGTGQALDTARRGDADMVLVHAREAEEKFIAEG